MSEKKHCSCHNENPEEKKCNCHEHNHKDCGCHGDKTSEKCTCGDDCDCTEGCTCGCQEGKECHCHDEESGCGCEHESKGNEYLDLARQIAADFENFRRHALEEIKQSKIAGQASVIEVFLPCLDTFKEAKKSITDQAVLEGVEMIENKINDALTSLGVEKIASIGEVYNPHLHNVIAVFKDESKENDVILDEYQAGYKFNGKVIRYSKVIVNKKED